MSVFAQHTITVKHTYYTLEFDTVLKSPLISWYIQTTSHYKVSQDPKTKIDRSTVAAFHQDPLIKAKYQVANDNEYKNFSQRTNVTACGNCYDKGHLSPYTAFGFDLTAAKESMYYTNTAPQVSFMNEHQWEQAEQYILKTLSPKYDNIYVYTGCLYSTQKMRDVPIPDYYWKVIIYNGKMEAWLEPNKLTSSTNPDDIKIDVPTLKKTILKYYPNLKLAF